MANQLLILFKEMTILMAKESSKIIQKQFTTSHWLLSKTIRVHSIDLISNMIKGMESIKILLLYLIIRNFLLLCIIKADQHNKESLLQN